LARSVAYVSCGTSVSGGGTFLLPMLDEVSLDVVARAQRVRRGFGWGDVLVVAATIIWGVNVVVVKRPSPTADHSPTLRSATFSEGWPSAAWRDGWKIPWCAREVPTRG
jgi:drug/metabolite transporter (DMT)-like permease